MATMPGYSSDGAARYDRTAEPIMAPFAALLVDAAQIHTEGCVLDLICGPGFATVVAAERAGPMGTVVGVDPDPAMVQVASGHGGGYAITWLHAAPDALPMATETMDAVVSLHGIGSLAEPRHALAEALRVVRKTGSLAATIWSELADNPYLAAHERALADLGAEDALAVLYSALGYRVEDLLRDLRAAGWHEPVAREVTVRIRLAGTTAAVADRLRGLPWGAGLSTDQALTAARSVLDSLAEFAEADGSVVVPFRSQLAHAYP